MNNIKKSILLAVSCLVLNITATAQDYNAIRTNKTATYDPNTDLVTINLDTWVAGYKSNVWTPATETQVPLDIVLVLDVSGSMGYEMGRNTTASNKANNRLTALKNACNTFIDNITTNAVANNVDHRISIVKFSGDEKGVKYTTTTNTIESYTKVSSSNLDIWGTNYYVKDGEEYRKIDRNHGYTSGNRYWYYTDLGAANGRINNINSLDVYEKTTKTERVTTTTSIEVGNDTYRNTNANPAETQYQANYTQVVANLTSLSNGGDEKLKGDINSLKYGGGTATDSGFKFAKSVLELIPSTRESAKLIVMFTDGAPDDKDDAIEAANLVKPYATIYTVGTFTSNDTSIDTYMSKASSNYTASGTNTGETKYYMKASNAQALENVFVTISQEAQQTGSGSSAGAGANLAAENNVTLKDIVTSDFVIPQTGGQPSNISFSLVPAKTVTVNSDAVRNETTHAPRYEDYTVEWETDESKFTTLTPAEGDIAIDGNSLNINGKIFDFSANWIGVEEKWTIGNSNYDEQQQVKGKKLVITFTIKPDAAKNGGLVTTNTEDSGIYIGEDKVSEIKKVTYKVPNPVYIPANITIRKSGMLPGESAIFEVTATGTDYSKTYTVAMTANESGEMKDAVIMKVPIVTNPNAEAAGEALDYITYTVKETTWSWAYDSAAQACQETANETVTTNSITRVMTNSEKTHLFEFKNTPKSTTPKHGESNANNIFAK